MTPETYIEGQTYVVCPTHMYKRATLLFDRVNAPEPLAREYGLPESVRLEMSEVEQTIQERLAPVVQEYQNTVLYGDIDAGLNDRIIWKAVRTISDVYNERQIPLVPMYDSINSFTCAFSDGKERAFCAAFESIRVPIEDDLDWKQVMGFREDEDSLHKYRSFRIWLRDLPNAESVNQIKERIEQALDQYEASLKKHGIKTVTGVISEILSWDTLAGAAAGGGLVTYLTGPVGGLIASGAILAGKVAVSLTEHQLDLKDVERGEGSEVALIYDIRKKFGVKD